LQRLTCMKRPLARGLAASAVITISLVACVGNRSRASDPSEASTTGASVNPVKSGPATPWPNGGVEATSPAPASPMKGACPKGQPNRLSMDRTACIDSCRGYDETVQLGSSCISQYASCASKCEATFPR
jgi:hypothetical protein